MRASAQVASDVGANGPVAVAAAPPQGKLLDQLCDALRSRHFSRRIEQTFCLWVRRFIYFHRLRHPPEMAEREINAFLAHLAIEDKVSTPTQNQALSALLFLYRQGLACEIEDLGETIWAAKSTPTIAYSGRHCAPLLMQSVPTSANRLLEWARDQGSHTFVGASPPELFNRVARAGSAAYLAPIGRHRAGFLDKRG